MMAMNAKQPFTMHAALQEPKYSSLHSSSEAMRRVCLPAPQLQGNIFGSFDESLLARAEALAAVDIVSHGKSHPFKPDATYHTMSSVPCTSTSSAVALSHPAALTSHPHHAVHPALDGDLLEHLSPSLAVGGLGEPPGWRRENLPSPGAPSGPGSGASLESPGRPRPPARLYPGKPCSSQQGKTGLSSPSTSCFDLMSLGTLRGKRSAAGGRAGRDHRTARGGGWDAPALVALHRDCRFPGAREEPGTDSLSGKPRHPDLVRRSRLGSSARIAELDGDAPARRVRCETQLAAAKPFSASVITALCKKIRQEKKRRSYQGNRDWI
nr:PREDICTED: POU domain, class 4, transcription factor 3 [Struthio camelus australis]